MVKQGDEEKQTVNKKTKTTNKSETRVFSSGRA